MLRDSVSAALLGANAMGALVYLGVAPQAWVDPKLRGMNGVSGDFALWATRAVPVFFLLFLIDVFWGVSMLVRPQWRSGRRYATVWLVWLLALAVDFWHHS